MLDELQSEILTDIERDKVAKFAEDKFLLNAVKKFILAVVYDHGILVKGKEALQDWQTNCQSPQ
jgi:hypothetical protein